MKFIMLITLLSISGLAHANKQYVQNPVKVTFRSGPGTEFKIVRMMEIDSAVTVIEEKGEWTKVQDEEGKEGYILSRFINKEVPISLRYKWLNDQYKKLKVKNEELKQMQDNVSLRLSATEKALKTSEESFENTQNDYQELKSGSADYLNLKSTYEDTKKSLEEQNSKIIELEAIQLREYIYAALTGISILLLGLIIGLLAKRKRSYSSIQL